MREGWHLAFDFTLARADTLVIIECPRWLCLRRIAWRSAFGVDRAIPATCYLMQGAVREAAARESRVHRGGTEG